MREVLFLFGSLSDHDIEWLASVGRPRVLTEKQVLIHQGLPIEEIYLLLDGVLAVRVGEKAEVELAKLRPGEIMGELSFLDGRPASATVLAIEPSRVLAIPRLELTRKLGFDDAFAARFYCGLSLFLVNRLRQREERMGFGAPGATRAEDQDELDPNLLDQTSLAAARFEHLLIRVRET